MSRPWQTVAAAGALAIGITSAAAAETLEWTAGQIGGGWYTMASGMAKLLMDANPDLTIKVVPGGGTANPSKVQKGQSQLGMGLDIFTFAARNGTGIYDGAPHDKLMMIGMSFSDNYMHLLRAKNAPLDFAGLFKDGKDVALAVTKAGSSDEQTFQYVMDYYGTSYDDLRDNRDFKINHGNYSEMASQFKDGQVDYVFFTLGIPGAAAIEMLEGRNAELVPWPKDVQQALHDKYGYKIGVIPAGTYPDQSEDVPTVIMGTTLMVNADVSEDTVYQITKTLCENTDKLPDIHQSMSVFDCATAAKDPPAPIHPGAARYYKEKGYM